MNFIFSNLTQTIIQNIGQKAIKMVYDLKGKRPVKNLPVSAADRLKPSITDKQVIQLAKWGFNN